MKKKISKETKIFIARIIAWALFSCVSPIVFIGLRYDLFRKFGTLQLSGWGLVGIIILIAFLYSLIKYIKAGFIEYSMTKQIITGVLKVVMPLGALLVLCIAIKSNLEYFIQALELTLVCEAIAIPINPFPKWVYEKTQGNFESMVDLVASKLNNKKEN